MPEAAIDFAASFRSVAKRVCLASGAACGATFTYQGPNGVDLTMRDGIDVLGGYEASFGTYEVDERAQTITRHVDGSITRGLIGQSLTRAYRFSDGRLTMRSVRPEERWSTMWERY